MIFSSPRRGADDQISIDLMYQLPRLHTASNRTTAGMEPSLPPAPVNFCDSIGVADALTHVARKVADGVFPALFFFSFTKHVATVRIVFVLLTRNVRGHVKQIPQDE